MNRSELMKLGTNAILARGKRNDAVAQAEIDSRNKMDRMHRQGQIFGMVNSGIQTAGMLAGTAFDMKAASDAQAQAEADRALTQPLRELQVADATNTLEQKGTDQAFLKDAQTFGATEPDVGLGMDDAGPVNEGFRRHDETVNDLAVGTGASPQAIQTATVNPAMNPALAEAGARNQQADTTFYDLISKGMPPQQAAVKVGGAKNLSPDLRQMVLKSATGAQDTATKQANALEMENLRNTNSIARDAAKPNNTNDLKSQMDEMRLNNLQFKQFEREYELNNPLPDKPLGNYPTTLERENYKAAINTYNENKLAQWNERMPGAQPPSQPVNQMPTQPAPQAPQQPKSEAEWRGDLTKKLGQPDGQGGVYGPDDIERAIQLLRAKQLIR